MSEKIYVIGHKSPDLDSVAGAISYAKYKNITEKTDIYTPAIAGEINKETKYVLEKYGLQKPELLEDVKDKKLILVDHNEFSQAIDGIVEANIVEILDHHKLDFKYSEPINVLIKAWGASCSIIYYLYTSQNLEIEKDLAALLLSAILVDTVITKSPTTTEIDKNIIKELARLAQIQDWREYGMEIFKVRSSINDLTAKEILKSDFKDFNFSAGKFGIGQVETVDLSEFESREEELMDEIKNLQSEEAYHSVILFITDIIKEGSKFLVATKDEAGFNEAMTAELQGGKVWIDGIISRKKQVAPKLTDQFDK